ncbi:terminase [Mycolicibacterium sp. J2]|uniref:terminase n=1 Tax=Mycolicibacterium sp. J2 TaxID=2993511 RepID=UPI00224B187D|nr:terminase [Mycolicibacterium sp. J2]MCX2712048.1 terminase [Mycolicibacterium sp. J2]
MTTTSKMVPPVPEGTGDSGSRLWRDILGKYELEEHELALLREAVRTVDQLDKLHDITEAEGLTVDGPHGSKAHPALTEARQLRIALARVLAALRLPAGDEDDQAKVRRPQRRAGVRGVYSAGA